MYCGLSHFSRVRRFATPWTVACQAPLGILQAGVLEWVAVPGSSFFREPVNHLIRMHFAKNDETLNEALNRLEAMHILKK